MRSSGLGLAELWRLLPTHLPRPLGLEGKGKPPIKAAGSHGRIMLAHREDARAEGQTWSISAAARLKLDSPVDLCLAREWRSVELELIDHCQECLDRQTQSTRQLRR